MARQPDQITERQQRFVEAYAACGNATEAARKAGYTDPSKGRQLVAKSNVAAAIAALAEKRKSKSIASAEERHAFWTRVFKSGRYEMKDRLKASELLGRAQGDFLERHEIVSGSLIDVMVYVPSNARG
jgi:phage terminase small subunit